MDKYARTSSVVMDTGNALARGRLLCADAIYMNIDELKEIHDYAKRNVVVISYSLWCGCFYCCETFPAFEVKDYVNRGETALCPRCGIDAVIGDASGVPLATLLLSEMAEHWFGMENAIPASELRALQKNKADWKTYRRLLGYDETEIEFDNTTEAESD